MVNMMLLISADLDGLTNLEPQGGCDDPDFAYYFKMKCSNCGEVSQKNTCVMLSETLPLPNGRGETNLVQKCKFCGREGIVTMIPGKGKSLTSSAAEERNYTPLMVFDCRGLEPVDFEFGDGWRAESLSGTEFENIDLSGGDFAEYCEKGKYPVMLSNLRSRFDVVK